MIALAFLEQIEMHKTNLDRVKVMKRDFPCVHVSPSRERAHVRVLKATRPFFLMGSYMGEDKNKFKCHLCPAGFTAKASLKKHQLIHTGEKLCAKCGKRFRTGSDYKKNIKHLFTQTRSHLNVPIVERHLTKKPN